MSADICTPIKIVNTPDCASCYKTTVQALPYDFDFDLNYVTFPSSPNPFDIHIGLFNDYVVYYSFTGSSWQIEGYRLSTDSADWSKITSKPSTFPPSTHTHPNYEGQIAILQQFDDVIQSNFTQLTLDLQSLENQLNSISISDVDNLSAELSNLQSQISSATGDNWGTQTVVSDSSFTGNGTSSSPLSISNGGITNTKLATDSVTTTKIINGAVTDIKLANNSVTSNKIFDGSVSSSKLADNSVTSNKIQNSAVTISKLPPGATPTTYLRGDGVWSVPIYSTPYQESNSTLTVNNNGIYLVFVSSGTNTSFSSTSFDFNKNAITIGSYSIPQYGYTTIPSVQTLNAGDLLEITGSGLIDTKIILIFLST